MLASCVIEFIQWKKEIQSSSNIIEDTPREELEVYEFNGKYF